MGLTPPPPLVMPRLLTRPVDVDLNDARHREAWAKFEAEREVDAGEGYRPVPINELCFVQQQMRDIVTERQGYRPSLMPMPEPPSIRF